MRNKNMMQHKNNGIKLTLWWLLLSLGLVVVDQVTKLLVVRHLRLLEPVKVLPFFNLTLQFNDGAAFSFLGSAGGWQVYLLMAVSLLVAIALIIWLVRTPRADWLMSLALSLILGGAVGNLIDRVRLGYVIDFCDFHIGTWHFYTFNFADSAITVGAVLLVFKLLFGKMSDK